MSDILTSPELTAEQASSLTRATNYGTWRFQKTWKPLYIADAEGCWITDGAGKRETIPAIYELEGDKLKICACFKGEERPTDFSAKKEGQCLWICERAK